MPIWRGTTSTDWGTASNWDTGVVPTTLTDAIFDATSTLPCTTGSVGGVGRQCRDLITTGFTNVLTVGTATNLGYIQVSRNITLGNSAGHIAGLSYIGIVGATCTLDVASGFTVPYLAFGSISGSGGTGTTTLVRSFVVTTLLKSGVGGSTATVTAGSAMSIDLTNGTITGGTGVILLNTNVTLKLFGTTTYGNNIATNGNVTSQAGSTISLNGFLNHLGGTLNLSSGTIVPGTAILNQGGAFSLNMGTNELYSYSWISGINSTLTLLSNIVIQSCYYYSSGGASVISGAFNITVKGTVSLANHTYTGGKIVLTGDGTSADALATFSGTTMTVTAFTLGSINGVNLGRIAIGQTITGPGIPANTVVVAQLTGTANQLGTYQVSNSFTLGSTAIKGVNCAILGQSSTNTIEIDALANAFAYIAGLTLNTFRYLSTNTGAYSASTVGVSTIAGTIDFQGIGSSTRFIRNLSLGGGGIAQNTTILSDIWVENLSCTALSGISQSGVRKLYILGNATINNGTTASFVIQPEVVLYGSAPCTFTCTALNANITIDKVGGTVTNMSNFNYVTTTVGIPYTFKLDNGTFIHGPYTTTIGSTAIFNTPGVNWNNITVNNTVTLTINALLNITGTLLCSGSATFTGTHGFTTQNFTCTLAASTITLQNINANPSAEYIVNGVLTLIGTLANRIILQAAGSATFNGTITPVGQLNYLSGTIPSIGMTVSQATGVSPVGLIGLLPNRPVITGGTSPTFTISPSATTVIGVSFSMRAGYKAKFTLTNGTGSQNVAYTTTQDIDSNAGATITSFGSYTDAIGQPSANLFRTLNWGPLIAPSGSVYYTFVN